MSRKRESGTGQRAGEDLRPSSQSPLESRWPDAQVSALEAHLLASVPCRFPHVALPLPTLGLSMSHPFQSFQILDPLTPASSVSFSPLLSFLVLRASEPYTSSLLSKFLSLY